MPSPFLKALALAALLALAACGPDRSAEDPEEPAVLEPAPEVAPALPPVQMEPLEPLASGTLLVRSPEADARAVLEAFFAQRVVAQRTDLDRDTPLGFGCVTQVGLDPVALAQVPPEWADVLDQTALRALVDLDAGAYALRLDPGLVVPHTCGGVGAGLLRVSRPALGPGGDHAVLSFRVDQPGSTADFLALFERTPSGWDFLASHVVRAQAQPG